MSRSRRPTEKRSWSRSKREAALQRAELRTESIPRAAAAGPTSHAVKITDPETAAAIEAFLSRRDAGQ